MELKLDSFINRNLNWIMDIVPFYELEPKTASFRNGFGSESSMVLDGNCIDPIPRNSQ